jgi:signal transduction histidine kinase
VSSLRWRISLAFAAVVAGVAALIGLLVYQQTASDRIGRARELQAQRVRVAAFEYASVHELSFGATLNDPSAPHALAAAVGRDAVATYVDTGGRHPVVWAGAPANGGAIFVRASLAEDIRALGALRRSLITIGAIAALAGALVGLVLADRLSRRLRLAAAAAGRIGAGDLDARIAIEGKDEVGVLAAAVDGMAESLKRRVEQEQRFAADVAHELRTPLAGLTSAAGLLESGGAADLVRDSAGRLRTLVEDLLEIARLDSGTERADLRWIDLERFTRDVAAPYGASVEAAVDARVLTDPRRLERVMVNLLENARRHGAPPITVRSRADRIEVLDRGPGFSPELLASATERFKTGAVARGGGTGLGLAIASGQAQVISARLELANRDDGGAVVAIVFPTVAEPE